MVGNIYLAKIYFTDISELDENTTIEDFSVVREETNRRVGKLK